ncbi:MAG TPA: PilZ domain-containing protein [Thermodesulfobacteriota bacterium]|nr:PilZ domain-containing protein [Thermodesulfobacteriota bacterium]
MSDKERREHPRILVDEKVTFSTNHPINDGFTYNLSPNGLSLLSDVALPVDASICINIHLTKYDSENMLVDEVVTVEGKVVWVTEHPNQQAKMGIKFNRPNAELLKYYMKNSAEL